MTTSQRVRQAAQTRRTRVPGSTAAGVIGASCPTALPPGAAVPFAVALPTCAATSAPRPDSVVPLATALPPGAAVPLAAALPTGFGVLLATAPPPDAAVSLADALRTIATVLLAAAVLSAAALRTSATTAAPPLAAAVPLVAALSPGAAVPLAATLPPGAAVPLAAPLSLRCSATVTVAGATTAGSAASTGAASVPEVKARWRPVSGKGMSAGSGRRLRSATDTYSRPRACEPGSAAG